MSPEPHAPGDVPGPDAPAPQPGLFASGSSIALGVIGFGFPVVGMIASFAGIWFAVTGFRRGRASNYRPSVTCGIIGMAVDCLGIVYWICAILFESYR